MNDCLFCERNFPPERVIGESDLWYAIWDLNPVSPGHALVIPKQHIESFFDLGEQEAAAGLVLLKEVRNKIHKERTPDGYNIGINDGAAAGRTVHHLHVHLIPRYVGDMTDPRGGVRYCIPEKGRYE